MSEVLRGEILKEKTSATYSSTSTRPSTGARPTASTQRNVRLNDTMSQRYDSRRSWNENRNWNDARSESRAAETGNETLDQVKKGMTMSEVESILGQGSPNGDCEGRKFVVVRYTSTEVPGIITVVYKDQRVVSKAQLEG